MRGVAPLQVQAFALVEFHEVPVSLFHQATDVSLQGSMTLWCISSPVFGISKLAEGRLSIIQTTNEDTEQDWTQD